MDERVLALRQETYRLFVELGRAPTVDEVARGRGVSADQVASAWRQLHEAHALVLDQETGQIRMAAPFSAVPTPFHVQAAGRSWYANCAWDAFGICGALHIDGAIDTACGDCGEPIAIEVRDEKPIPDRLLFHCLVPARHWWDDVVFT